MLSSIVWKKIRKTIDDKIKNNGYDYTLSNNPPSCKIIIVEAALRSRMDEFLAQEAFLKLLNDKLRAAEATLKITKHECLNECINIDVKIERALINPTTTTEAY